MERNLQRMSEFWRRHLGVDVTALRGGGAAGGLAAALITTAKIIWAQRSSRALKRSLAHARLARALEGADLVITAIYGRGRLRRVDDAQKSAERRRADGAESVHRYRICALRRASLTLRESMRDAAELLSESVLRGNAECRQ